ncbi:acylphosphatase [Rhodoplanes sp. TEM]|uniref:acylphosphatase n=1 Tax=Rhodoplanes tepidamans TaxID=200616 RepID=A0ABT5JDX5_RHOTP|nr:MULTISPECIES: acylphosphatase [Rhodoplanes]MDC7787812.1 acylphosphatase [Rhodoplanes tepidamans]MDC7987424.1 acylphosphatase [Rhodoplanes sp. TEM]MDQ0357728.1 acylphosphatase [Rhodoplanes tepidamans]
MSGAATVVRLLLVRGRVQGVGYRGWAEGEATRRGLEGWVRNRVGGAVEILVAGPPGLVDDFVAACRRGPFRARVDDIAVDAASPRWLEQRRPGELFSVLSTM